MSVGEVLRPVRQRYAEWLQLDDAAVVAELTDAPDQVRALQLVLRMERDATPSWHAALGLAASGCALLCLDPRAEPGGEWHEQIAAYCEVNIRKVNRRGRGAQWLATADLPGLTLGGGVTELRVLVPGAVEQLDKRVAKLQVGGTDLPIDDPVQTVVPDGPLLTVLVSVETAMTAGKLIAQAGHAGMIGASLLAGSDPVTLEAWYRQGCPVRVHRIDPRAWTGLTEQLADPERAWQHGRLLAVRDAGYTEVAPGTVTVLGRFDPQIVTD